MTYKLKLNQVREILNLEIKFEIVTLLDGTKVESEKFEPGYPAFVVAEDGSKVNAPAGEHTLADGAIMKVDENGLIVEISAAAEEVEDESVIADDTTVQVSGAKFEDEEVAKESVSVAMEEIAKVNEAMKMVFAAIEEVAKEVAIVKEEMGSMKGKMEKFSKAPAANPIPKVTPELKEAFDAIEAKSAFLKSIAKK